MLKKFFLNLLSSFIGAWLAIVFAGIAAVIILVGIISNAMGSSIANVAKDSVLRISLDGALEERDFAREINALALLDNNFANSQSIETLVSAIKGASGDDRIKAIYLDCGGVSAAPASLNAVRTALIDFKKSGKKIYAYADAMTQGCYFVASVADEISLNPAGNFSLSGLGGESLFYKGLLDKIGVEFQAVRVGKGKAAIEPFTSDSMSFVARQQNEQLIDTLWAQIRRGVAEYRKGVIPAYIDTLINRDYISCKPAAFALENKLVDKLEYRHQFEERLAKAVGQKDGLENIAEPAMTAVMDDTFNPNPNAANQIAVLYACGGIDDFLSGGGINSQEMVELILDFADNDKIEALVLRVNSPGGSAFGSEQIWEALKVFKSKGKPFVVSMGDYAASGGYYISCNAERIFADPYTITGSVGIFGLIPNFKGLMDKVGLHAEMVATNPDGVFPTGMKPMDEKQLAAMQSMVENGYDLFVSRVAEGRHLSVAKVKEFADGRPLSAVNAMQFGLVDSLGSLSDAIEWTRKKAKLSDPAIVIYPQLEPNFMTLMANMQGYASILSILNENNPQKAAAMTLKLFERNFNSGKIMAQMQPLEIRM